MCTTSFICYCCVVADEDKVAMNLVEYNNIAAFYGCGFKKILQAGEQHFFLAIRESLFVAVPEIPISLTNNYTATPAWQERLDQCFKDLTLRPSEPFWTLFHFDEEQPFANVAQNEH